MLLTKPEADIGNTEALLEADAGYWATATERTEPGTGYLLLQSNGNLYQVLYVQ